MPSDAATWAAIGLVAGVTLASRFAGPLLMARVGGPAWIERFLEGLSISVVAALVGSIAAQGGQREIAAIGIAAVAMLATRSAVWAMLAGMTAAAAWSLLAAP